MPNENYYYATGTEVTSIADAIRNKTKSVKQIEFPDGFVSEIGNIEITNPKTVFFYDYDGTLLYSYTAAEFQALTEMPTNPTHTGLVAQGWNWTLSDAKTYVSTHEYLNIGQMYDTTDGETRLYITIDNDILKTIKLCWYQGDANGANISWGDGSELESVSKSGAVNLEHTYVTTGDYVIIIYTVKGYINLGGGSNSSVVLGEASNSKGAINLSYLKKVEVGHGISRINDYAFMDHTCLGTITLPSTLLQMKAYAFQNCYKLQCMIIPILIDSIATSLLNACYNLTVVSIPKTVTNIGSSAFYTCRNLETITIPEGMTTLYSSVFYGCYLLKYVNIPSSVTAFETSPFAHCYNIKHVSVPSGVTAITQGCFNSCYNLKSIDLPSNLTSIASSAFRYCYALSSISIPNTVTSIGDYAFEGCYSLNEITLPSNITVINNNAFRYTNIKNITIPSGITNIKAYAFSDCTKLQSITLPNTLTTIGTYVFYGCYSLESINVPSSVTSIGERAFYGCANLKNFTMPNITSIPQYTFAICKNFRSLTIPNTVTNIGVYAFINCGCREYHFLSATPPTLANANAFNAILSDCIIYVPYSADHSILNTYKTTTNWVSYASYMQEEPES